MVATPVVVAAVRTPQGTEDGALAGVRSEDLSIPVVEELLDRTGLPGETVDDLLWGCAQQRDEQGTKMARVIALMSDLGEATPASTINRWCASSAEAIMRGADAIAAGQRECLIAGGVESMTRAMLLPCSSRCCAQPHSRSSTSSPVSPVRSSISLMSGMERSSLRTSAYTPSSLPCGVRTASTITGVAIVTHRPAVC